MKEEKLPWWLDSELWGNFIVIITGLCCMSLHFLTDPYFSKFILNPGRRVDLFLLFYILMIILNLFVGFRIRKKLYKKNQKEI